MKNNDSAAFDPNVFTGFKYQISAHEKCLEEIENLESYRMMKHFYVLLLNLRK